MTMEQRAKFLAKRYKAAAKKSCGATIEMAETIVQAVHELKGRPLAVFYKAIGLDPESSTVRKLIIIGRSSPRLKRHLNRLPSAWTTLYELARLKSDEFETLLASCALHPLATCDELEAALQRGDKKKDQDRQRVSLPFRFNLSRLSDSRRRDFVDRLMALCGDFKIPWAPSKTCQAAIKNLVNPPPSVPFGTSKAQRVTGAVM
jgi:hypothetical protein